MAVFSGPNPTNDGLILHLDAANKRSYPLVGSTWFDLVSNNISGALENTTNFSASKNGMFLFNDDGNKILLNSSTAINNLTNNFTIEVLVNFTNFGDQYAVFTKGGNYTTGWTLYLRQGPQFTFIGHDTDGVSSGLVATPSGGVVAGTWYHVVYTYNQTSILGYINAELKVTQAYNKTFSSVGTVPTIGYDPNLTNAGYWPGDIAVIRLYNRALTQDEVYRNFQAVYARFTQENVYEGFSGDEIGDVLLSGDQQSGTGKLTISEN